VRAAVISAIIGMALVGAVVAGASRSACRWRVVPGSPATQLTAVSALSDADVWAVGMSGSRSVVLHWNGHGWRMTRSSVVALDLAAESARDVWVVGETSLRASAARPASMRWDGVRWKVVPVPGPLGSYLSGVSARSSHELWAVGAGRDGPLVVRWNGRGWRSVATGVANGLLHAIDAPWAVGTQGMASSTGAGSEDPLVVQLGGGRVRQATTPVLDSVDENLLAVDAVTSGDVWAVGSADVLGGRAPLVQRLEGGAWRDESVAGLPPREAALTAVAAFGSADAWVAGYNGFFDQQTVLAHWDGTRWSRAQGRSGIIFDLAALSPHDIWAVGNVYGAKGSGSRSLVERYACGS
jgi:hypothetical protein